LDISAFTAYSAAVDSDINYISAAVSSIPAQIQSDWEEANTASPAYIQNKPVDLEMSAGNGISITETNNTLVFAVSGNYADATEVDSDINYLSGVIDTKLDTTAFNDYSATALVDYYKKSETSGKTEIQNALGTKLDTTAFNNYSANAKTQIDSKLTKNDFDSYSAAVDNDIDYISAAVSSIPAQVQSDWSATNTASPAYILNKPNQIDMQCGTYLDITSANNQITLDADISAISAALVHIDTYNIGIIE
jgi:hypothetical protein